MKRLNKPNMASQQISPHHVRALTPKHHNFQTWRPVIPIKSKTPISSWVWPIPKCSWEMDRKYFADVRAHARNPNSPFFTSCKCWVAWNNFVFCNSIEFTYAEKLPVAIHDFPFNNEIMNVKRGIDDIYFRFTSSRYHQWITEEALDFRSKKNLLWRVVGPNLERLRPAKSRTLLGLLKCAVKRSCHSFHNKVWTCLLIWIAHPNRKAPSMQ